MKNIHILPTDKPTTLFKDDFGNFIYSINIDQEQNHFEPQHIYITSDEEIKEGEICIYGKSLFLVENIFYNSGAFRHLSPKIKIKGKLLPNMKAGEFDSMTPLNKIILTTDQDLDGVQAIDDEFLEWFVKNPSCEFADVNDWLDDNGNIGGDKRYQLCNHLYNKQIIPKEEPKQETLEEVAHEMLVDYGIKSIGQSIGVPTVKKLMVNMAKWQAERSQSIVPFDAYNIEVFAIKPDEQGKLFAYIGYKISNGNFHFSIVPFTEPKEEPEQETVEEREPYWELVDKKAEKNNTIDLDAYANGIRDGAKWQAERMYSEEEVLELILKSKIETSNLYYEDMKEWFEQFKKK